jgi:hypothetical protein
VLASAWSDARKAIGRPELHLHDLRHSGLTWSAAAGATVAELMRRGGHASPAAALRYKHASEDRDRALADALAGLATKADVAGLADFSRTRRVSRTSGGDKVGPDQGAGDGNRTRMTSLEDWFRPNSPPPPLDEIPGQRPCRLPAGARL